jgi:hypothetical protein
MGCFEGRGVPVLYKGRKVPKESLRAGVCAGDKNLGGECKQAHLNSTCS